MESTQSSVIDQIVKSGRMTVGGVRPEQVHEPETGQDLASLLETANREGLAVAPVGGGTHAGVGNNPSRLDWIVSTRKLSQVISYEPPDMTLSVEAGARLGDVQAILAEKGQGLPIEVSDPAHATIGGILATALYGPKRLGSGTLRDYLIGINVAYPDGTLAKAGGMVVKNVSGFDLMRMHHGALGTLGVIVSANFKVLPKPRSERTVLMSAPDVGEVASLNTVLGTSRARPAAFEVTRKPGEYALAIRIEGRERTTELLANELAGALGEGASVLEPAESEKYWSDYLTGFRSDDHVTDCWLRLRVKPSQSLTLLERVSDLLADTYSGDAKLTVSPALGFLDVRLDCATATELRRLVGSLRSIAPRTVVVSAPPAAKSELDVWGDSIESLDLMRLLKAEFDPNGILNPGRFVGGL
jgi:glycolate oxidase FAD binding subunit